MDADDKTASEYLGLVGKQKEIVDELEKQFAKEREKQYRILQQVNAENQANQPKQPEKIKPIYLVHFIEEDV